jgi:hypothetical protein
MPEGEPTVDDVVTAWNEPGNTAVRTATRPPRGPVGPFQVIGAGRGVTASPEGAYEVRVAVGVSRATILRPGEVVYPRLVFFWYPAGYRDGPATVVFQLGRSGFDLDQAVMHFPPNTDVRTAPLAVHHPDGRLSLV